MSGLDFGIWEAFVAECGSEFDRLNVIRAGTSFAYIFKVSGIYILYGRHFTLPTHYENKQDSKLQMEKRGAINLLFWGILEK